MDKKNKDQIVKELEDFRKILSYYAKNRFDDYGPDLSEERKQLNRMLPKIKKYIVQAKIPTKISGRAPVAMGGAPFTMDIFDDIFLNERTPLAVNLDNTLDAVDKCLGILEAGEDITKSLSGLSRFHRCGPLGNEACNQGDFIEKGYSEKNIFLDIPYEGYQDRQDILKEVISEAGLEAIIAKETLTSNAVLCKVCKLIQTCKYGISDISFNRPSVTYELGLMHGFGFKVCILLQETLGKFTDIEGLDHTSYANDLELRIKLANWLVHNVPEANTPKIKQYIANAENKLAGGVAKLYPLTILKKRPLRT